MVLLKLTSPLHNAFVPNQDTHDDILIAQKDYIAIKVDMIKAYDRLE